MALCLKNRTSIQCRSHNQKMVKLAGSIKFVPNYIKNKLLWIEKDKRDSQKVYENKLQRKAADS
jgi:hypothetical protein